MINAIRYVGGYLVTWPQKARFELAVSRVVPAPGDESSVVIEGKVLHCAGAPPPNTLVRLTIPLSSLPVTATHWARIWRNRGLNMFVAFTTNAAGIPIRTEVKNDAIKSASRSHSKHDALPAQSPVNS